MKQVSFLLLFCIFFIYLISLDCSSMFEYEEKTSDTSTNVTELAPLVFQSFVLPQEQDVPLSKAVKGLIDANKKRILLIMDHNSVRKTTEYVARFTIDRDITVIPHNNTKIDIANEKFILTRDNETVVYTVEYVIQSEGLHLENGDLQFTSFSLLRNDNAILTKDIMGIIDTVQHRIVIPVPHSILIKTTQFVPSFTVTNKTVVTPKLKVLQDFKVPITYNLKKDNASISYTTDIVVLKDSITVMPKDDITFTNFQFLKSDNPHMKELTDIQGIIDTVNKRIVLTVFSDTFASDTIFTPKFTLSNGVVSNIASGVKQDFKNPVFYTLSLHDTDQIYKVEVVIDTASIKKDSKTISFNTFQFLKLDNPHMKELTNIQGIIDTVNKRVVLTVFSDTFASDTIFMPKFTLSNGVVSNIASGVKQDFKNPVFYMLSLHGTDQIYKVEVVIDTASIKKDSKTISFDTFQFLKLDNLHMKELTDIQGIIDTVNKRVVLTVFSDTFASDTIFTPKFTLSNGVVSNIASGVKQDFKNPVFYTLSLHGTDQIYKVEVVIDTASIKKDSKTISFDTFQFLKLDNLHMKELTDIQGIIDTVNKRVVLTVFSDTFASDTIFTPKFTLSNGVVSNIASGVKQDFKNPVFYTLSLHGTDQIYKVEVVIDTASIKKDSKIISFNTFQFLKSDNPHMKELTDIQGIIDTVNKRVVLTVFSDTFVSDTIFTPKFTLSNGVVSNIASGVKQDFKNPVFYTLSLHGTDQIYKVEVVIDTASIKKDSKTISFDTFQFLKLDNLHMKELTDIQGIIDTVNKRVVLTVFSDTFASDTIFTPKFTLSNGVVSNIASGVKQDFKNPVFYTLSLHGTDQIYKVEVVIDTASIKKDSKTISFNTFQFLKLDNPHMKELTDIQGIIDTVNKRVVLTVFSDTFASDTIFTPKFTLSNGVVSNIASGAKQDFKNPVFYTLSLYGTDQIYKVSVVIDSRSVNKKIPYISAFNFEKKNNAHMIETDDVVGIINTMQNEITLLLKQDTFSKSKRFIPTITTVHGGTLTPEANLKQDFSKPLYYTLKKGDFSQSYLVHTKVADDLPSSIDSTIINIFEFRRTENSAVTLDYKAIIDQKVNDITITIPTSLYRKKYDSSVKLLSLKPYIRGNYKTLAPDISAGLTLDINKQQSIIITDFDGNIKNYIITVALQKSNEAQLQSFILEKSKNVQMTTELSDVQGIIDHKQGIVLLEIRQASYDANKIFFPTIAMSDGASINPVVATPMDVSADIQYTVTSESGTHTTTYTIKVSIKKESIVQVRDVAFILFRSSNYGTTYDVSSYNKIIKKKDTNTYELYLAPHEYEFFKTRQLRFAFTTGFQSSIINNDTFRSVPVQYQIQSKDTLTRKTLTIDLQPLPIPKIVEIFMEDSVPGFWILPAKDEVYIYTYDLFNKKIVISLNSNKKSILYPIFKDFDNRNPYGFTASFSQTDTDATVDMDGISLQVTVTSPSLTEKELGTYTVSNGIYSITYTLYTQQKPTYTIISSKIYKLMAKDNAIGSVKYIKNADSSINLEITANGYQFIKIFDRRSNINKITETADYKINFGYGQFDYILKGAHGCDRKNEYKYDKKRFQTYITAEHKVVKHIYTYSPSSYINMPENYEGEIFDYTYTFSVRPVAEAFKKYDRISRICKEVYRDDLPARDIITTNLNTRSYNQLNEYKWFNYDYISNTYTIKYKKTQKKYSTLVDIM